MTEHTEYHRLNVRIWRVKTASFIVLALLIAGIARSDSIRAYCRPEFLEEIIKAGEPWSAIVFMLLFVFGTCLCLPGSIMIGLGTALFGPYWGFLHLWAGALAGASAAFIIARTFGRSIAAPMFGDRLRKYDSLIERNGFAAVLYVRLMCLPFAPFSYGFGLTSVGFRDYFFGTALGELVSIFVLTFFFAALRDVWVSGDVRRLGSPTMIAAFGLVAISVCMPKIVETLKWKTPLR